MPDALIVSAARTPIGRAHKGALVDVDAAELAVIALGGAIERSGIDPTVIDDIELAESMQGGGVLARYVAHRLGLVDVPGLADNRHCAAGLSAIQIGAGSIRAGMDRSCSPEAPRASARLRSCSSRCRRRPATSSAGHPSRTPTHRRPRPGT